MDSESKRGLEFLSGVLFFVTIILLMVSWTLKTAIIMLVCMILSLVFWLVAEHVPRPTTPVEDDPIRPLDDNDEWQRWYNTTHKKR